MIAAIGSRAMNLTKRSKTTKTAKIFGGAGIARV